MPTQRPLRGPIRDKSITTAQIAAEQKLIEDLLFLVPSEHFEVKLREEMSKPLSDELRAVAASLTESLKDWPPLGGIDPQAFADEIRAHADDPPAEEDIREEVEIARYTLLTRWIGAMVTVRFFPRQALLTDSLAPEGLPNFWKYVAREVPLGDDPDNDPTVREFVANVLKELPLRLPRGTVIERRVDGRFTVAVY